MNTKNERIYYVSQYDGRVHCIYDTDHEVLECGSVAYVGQWCSDENALRVDDEVNLWTILEIAEFYK